MNSKDNKTSEELKREVLQGLNQINSDVDRIQGRLTPGQLIDDALFGSVGNGPRAILDHLKANPIGAAFLSIGTLLLMEDENHMTYERQMKKRTAGALESSRYQATLLKAKVSGLKDRYLKKPTGEFDLGEGGELGASSIDQLKETVFNEIETVKNLDPMTYFALGAGLGAFTGIALPVSEKEQAFIDEKAGGRLSEFSSEFQSAINQSMKILKDEFIGKFTDVDVSVFGRKSSMNETGRNGS